MDIETTNPAGTIQSLDKVLESRKAADPSTSYTAKLFHKGLPKILGKVTEESCEVLEAAHEDGVTEMHGVDHLVYEVADLWFHSMVLLHYKGHSGQEVLTELARRFGTSGIEEKNSRPKENA